MDKVLIRFKSIAIVNDETEKIEYEVEADYIKDIDLSILTYDEPNIDGIDNRTKICFNEDEIMIERTGEHFNKMVFVKDGKSFGTFLIDQMKMNFDIKINEMLISQDKLVLDYNLVVGTDDVSQFKIEVKIKGEN